MTPQKDEREEERKRGFQKTKVKKEDKELDVIEAKKRY